MPDAARAARPQTTTGTTPAPPAPPARVAAPPVRVAAPPVRVGTPAPPAVRLQEGGAKKGVGPDEGKKLVQAAGPGEPLPQTVRETLEKSLGADLGGVRVHRSSQSSAAVDALSARAVTYGANVFLGPRERPTDLALLAHEVAHVVQQQGAPKVQKLSDGQTGDSFEAEAHRASAAVVRGERFEVRGRTSGSRAQRWGMDTVLNKIAGWANAIPGFRMFTVVLGVNPINMSAVERSPANVMRAVVEFIPGGNLITRALDTYGVFDKVGAWVSQQIASLGMVGGAIKDALMAFLRSLDASDFLDPGGVWERAKSIFTNPIDRIKNFVKGFITGILDFLRDAIMKPLAVLASKTEGYDLLKAVLGKDPITGEAVPQTADALIGGFMKLIGQTEVWENIKKGNAVARAFAWFKDTLSGVLAFVRQVPTLIITTLKSIVLDDLLPLTNLFGKVGRAFGGFIGNFFSWAGGQVLKLLEIIFEVVAPSVIPYVRKAAGAFKSIVQNPVGFVGNLVRAGIQGFKQFAGNFLNHLRKSLIDWLTGTLSGAAIYVPQALSLKEIIKFALSVLGLTWQNIRQKLVAAIGNPVVVVLETTFGLVVTLVKDGPAAAWQQIQEGVSNLKEMVMEQVMSFVLRRVVESAIQKLVTGLNPAGAFIQAIIAIYNTIMFVVERLRQIGQVLAAFIDSISAIAAGNIGAAASRVETTMGGLLTLVISFLARLAGLGKVSDAVLNIVKKVRAPIDKALDKVIAWIVAQAKKLGAFASATAKSILLRFTKPKTFSAAGESHRMWITEQGDPQVASSAMPLGARIGAWKRRVSSLPAADQPTATAQIGVADSINGELRKAAADALRARTAGNAAAVEAAQKIIDTKQAALQPALAALFTLFKDTGQATTDARIFALTETYDQVVVPLMRGNPPLVKGKPDIVTARFRTQWNNKQFPQAQGWITQMQRVLAAARNVGTAKLPVLTAVEVKIEGTVVDYTVRDRDIKKDIAADVSVEIKTWAPPRQRKAKDGRVITVPEQIQGRIETLRRQIQAAIKSKPPDPEYSIITAEIRGFNNLQPEFRSALLDEFINYRGLAASQNKRFTWRII